MPDPFYVPIRVEYIQIRPGLVFQKIAKPVPVGVEGGVVDHKIQAVVVFLVAIAKAFTTSKTELSSSSFKIYRKQKEIKPIWKNETKCQ